MAWIAAPRHSGTRPGYQTAAVSLSWRHPFKHTTFIACCNITTAMMHDLGWKQKDRVSIQHGVGEHLGMTRMAISDDPHTYAIQVKHGCGSVMFPLPRVTSEKRSATIVQSRIEDGALVIVRPDWAAPERVNAGTDGARAAMEDARARIATVPYSVPRASLMERVPDPMAGRRVG